MRMHTTRKRNNVVRNRMKTDGMRIVKKIGLLGTTLFATGKGYQREGYTSTTIATVDPRTPTSQ